MDYKEYDIVADEVLISLIQVGDEQAFATLYKRYSAPLYVHAYNILRNREEVRDIIQRVFLNIWERREQLHTEQNISAYLYRATKNSILNHVAHSKVVDRYLSNLSTVPYTSTNESDHLIREKQLQEIIAKEIQQLPKKMREIFELSRKDNLSHKEIASRLGISEKTVKNQISNALSLLKNKLPLLLYFYFTTMTQ